MFSHVVVGSNDIAASKKLYDAMFVAIGAEPGIIDEKGRALYVEDGMMFIVTKPLNGQPATPANGLTIGFKLDTPAQVDAWHDAGVANGATSIEDPPGIRETPEATYYIAYLRDLDGYKINALCHV